MKYVNKDCLLLLLELRDISLNKQTITTKSTQLLEPTQIPN